jgi:hypothetical protein
MKWLNRIFFAVGLACLVGTVAAVGPGTIADAALHLGAWFWPLAAVNLLWYAADARGWARVLGPAGRSPGMAGRLVRATVAGEAVNNATPLMNLGGEPVKGLLLRGRVPADTVVASLVVDNTIRTLATAVFLAVGLGLSLCVLNLEPRLVGGLVAAFAAIAVLVGLAFALQARGVLGRGLDLGRRLGIRPGTIEHHRPAADRIDAAIGGFYRGRRRDFAASLAWHLASRLIATAAAVLLTLMGCPVGILQALLIQTVSVLLNLAFAFIPLQIGAAEGGHFVLFQALGMDPAMGVAFSLVRRVRGLLWIGVGLLIGMAMSRGRAADAA